MGENADVPAGVQRRVRVTRGLPRPFPAEDGVCWREVGSHRKSYSNFLAKRGWRAAWFDMVKVGIFS